MGGFSSVKPYLGMVMSAGREVEDYLSKSQGGGSAEERSAQQAEALTADYNERQRRRADLLEQALATQRARLGALGIGSTEGSGAALIAGLRQRSAADGDDDAASLSRRLRTMTAGSGGGLLDGLQNGLGMARQVGSLFTSGD